MMQTAGPFGDVSSAVKWRPRAGGRRASAGTCRSRAGRSAARDRRCRSARSCRTPRCRSTRTTGVVAQLLVARPRHRRRVAIGSCGFRDQDRDERRGVSDRDRVEDEPVVDREQRRVGADADGDRQDGDGENPGLLNSARVAARRSVMGAVDRSPARLARSSSRLGALRWDQMHWAGTAARADGSPRRSRRPQRSRRRAATDCTECTDPGSRRRH